MKQENTFLVVVDESGIVRPMAGIWKNNGLGLISAEDFLKSKNGKDCSVAVVKIEVVEKKVF